MAHIKTLLATGILAMLAQIPQLSSAHSWPEAINTINNQGTMEGSTGYVRNFVPRAAPGFKGDETDSFQKTQVLSGSVPVCMTRQQAQMQSPGYPRLQASPGAKVAIRYAENGHVTIEQPGRPPAGGPVYIFGTTAPKQGQSLKAAWEWNEAGTGGDKTGKLLAQQPFDDGRCYEMNPSQNSSMRQGKAPLNGALPMPDYSGLPCQNDFVIPDDAQVGKPYTIYWVWNFTSPDPNMGGIEIYSDCFDIDVVQPVSGAANKMVSVPTFDCNQPVISAAVPQYFKSIVEAPASQTTVSQAGQFSTSAAAGIGGPVITVTAYVTASVAIQETVIITKTVLPPPTSAITTSNEASSVAATAAIASDSGTGVVYPIATVISPGGPSVVTDSSTSATEYPGATIPVSLSTNIVATSNVVASSAPPIVSAATSVPASIISAAIISAGTSTPATSFSTSSLAFYPTFTSVVSESASSTSSASPVNTAGEHSSTPSGNSSPMASGSPCKRSGQVARSKIFAGTEHEIRELQGNEKQWGNSAKFRLVN